MSELFQTWSCYQPEHNIRSRDQDTSWLSIRHIGLLVRHANNNSHSSCRDFGQSLAHQGQGLVAGNMPQCVSNNKVCVAIIMRAQPQEFVIVFCFVLDIIVINRHGAWPASQTPGATSVLQNKVKPIKSYRYGSIKDKCIV